MDPLRKESDGLLVSMMPHIEKSVETRCIEMMNMAQRPHSVCKHNKLHKLRGDRRDRVLKEFERADLSQLEMFDSDRELTFTWEHAQFFLKARQCTEETVLRQIVNKHTSINKNQINNINTFYGKESLVWRLFANDVLKQEEVQDLLKECRTDKQLCLALQYQVDYFQQVVNFDMMVQIVCNEFEAFANHHMANFLVIKLMEKSNPVQQTKLAFQFEAHQARLAFNQFGFIVISKVIENLDIQFTFNLCQALANDAAIFTAAVHNANASLLVQNVLDSQQLQFLSKWNPDYEIGQTHLIEYLTTNVLTVSHTFTGSKVISKCLERIKLAKIEGLLGAILTQFKELSTNEFGNYIIQTIIQRINQSDLKIVTVQISENLVDLSANKFSSQIIETIVRMRNLELNRMLLQVLVESPGKLAVKGRKKAVLDESDPMQKVMQDQFGNQVLKNLQNVLDRDGKRAMYNKAMSLFSTGMCNNYYCKQLIKNIQN